MKPPLTLTAVLALLPSWLAAEDLEADFLIAGGDESGCAAAVQAARLGVARIVLVSDIDWLGGQFCAQGAQPVDEWTLVAGKRAEFPASGAFQEILDRIHRHNRDTYGLAHPGNGWCGRNAIEPRAGAEIFEAWLAPYAKQVRILRGWEPARVITAGNRLTGAVFHNAKSEELTVHATLTADATDWGDVIRLSGAEYMAGPDLKSRFGEPSAPEHLEPGGNQEMNPITYCPMLRESATASPIPRPERYDLRSFADCRKTPPWVDWDGSGGIYNMAGWCIYTHRRIVDRRHHHLAPGTEALMLNWPAHDYPLSSLPKHVTDALEALEPGASQKNIVDMTPVQRRVVFADAKRRALEFVHWLQTDAPSAPEAGAPSFRQMVLAEDYGTPDRLPPKPYVREGLRLAALYVLREQDVRTEVANPLWAKAMAPDGVFGFQFNMDFHPTRRKFVGGDPSQPWQPRFEGARNWNAHSDRAMFPLRGLIPVKMDGLLGCSKNLGVTSMTQSSLRLHGQMIHAGAAVGTVASVALREHLEPRAVASSWQRIREVQRTLLRQGTLIWPWHDVRPEAAYFEAANLLTIAGIWRADPDSVLFRPEQVVTRAELAGALARLCRALPGAKDWPGPSAQPPGFADLPPSDENRAFIAALAAWGAFGAPQLTFGPREPATWGTLNAWLSGLGLPTFGTLAHPGVKNQPLTRAECVELLGRELQRVGECLPQNPAWLQPGSDADGDGKDDRNDPLPFDRDNNNVPDSLQPPA